MLTYITTYIMANVECKHTDATIFGLTKRLEALQDDINVLTHTISVQTIDDYTAPVFEPVVHTPEEIAREKEFLEFKFGIRRD